MDLSGVFQKLASKRVLAFFTVIFILTIAVLPRIQESSSEASRSPDMSFIYTVEELYEIAESYGAEGRNNYIVMRFTFDLVFPLIYGGFLISSPGGLAVHHYVLSSGELIFGEENTEYQHYIISGCGRMGSRFVHGETAIFVPGAQRWGKVRQRSIAHEGEGELRIITASYKTDRQNFRWAKTRVKNLYQTTANISNIVNQQLITEEEHAIMGALRMHALDVQTHAPLANNPAHINPEEIMYVLRGTGEAVSGDNRYKVKPGSLIYASEGETHGIYNTSSTHPLQYFVLEFIEHDRAWTEKGFQE